MEDERDIASILKLLLESEGYGVQVAYDGEKGLEEIRKNPPDIVIMDVDMPLLTGPQMAYQIFIHDCGLEEIPIVIVSGVADLHAIATRVGTPYWIEKPFEVDDLLKIVCNAVTDRVPPHPEIEMGTMH